MSDAGDRIYAATVGANGEIHGKGTFAAEVANNNALGNITLKDDLGTYGGIETLVSADHLDDRTRDRLISHTRQDVASTFAHALSAFRAAHEAKRIASTTRMLVWLVLILVLVVLVQTTLIWGAME